MKVVFSFGRMNPMTTGHMMIIKEMSKLDCDKVLVYLSHTQDKLNKKDPLKNKNPLSYEEKVAYAKTFVKENGLNNVEVVESSARTIMDALHEVNQSCDEIILACGSDRIDDFKTLVEKYNGTISSKTGLINFNFKNIEYHKMGTDRDPDADDTSGMSASKLRKFACEGNYEEFKKGIPSHSEDLIQELYNNIRTKMLG